MMSISKKTVAPIALLLFAFAQATEARSCYYDYRGRYRCSGLYGGTIGGIIVACVVPIILLLFLLFCCLRRRRRTRVDNEAYVNQPQPQQQQMYEQPAGTYGPGPQQYAQPQYAPPQQYEQPAQSYAAPTGPPPSGAPMYEANQYAAPPGAPPAAHTTGGEASAYYGNQNRV